MSLEQSGLSNWFSRFRRSGNRKGRKSGRSKLTINRRSLLEQLEERRLLVNHIFLDFGDGWNVPATGLYGGLSVLQGVQPTALQAALVGTGKPGDDSYDEGIGIMEEGLTVTPPYNIVGTASLINAFAGTGLVPPVVPTDALTLELSITAEIQRALEPFNFTVISSARSNLFNFPVPQGTTNGATTGQVFTNAGALMAGNDTPGDGISPVPGTARAPQNGSEDIYILLGGIFTSTGTPAAAVPDYIPLSADFAPAAANSNGAKPYRRDSGAVVDVNYWIERVLGDGSNLGVPGSNGSLNTAIANAALYTIGWDLGLSEVENGMSGPYTNYFDQNTQMIDQSSAFMEGGSDEGLSLNGVTLEEPISATNSAYFTRFPMMQNGANFQPFITPGTLGNPPLLDQQAFPTTSDPNDFFLPSATSIFRQGPDTLSFTLPDATLNEDPSITVNQYDLLANDPQIGLNPDVAYVTGTGAFDQIFVTKIDSTHAKVTVNAFDSNTYTNQIGTFNYNINLTKAVIPGRTADSTPFHVVVEGCNSDDQIFLDPTLGVNVVVDGGNTTNDPSSGTNIPAVKTLNITGNGAYTAKYTPNEPGTLVGVFTDANTTPAGQLIPEGLIPAQAGTLVIAGTAPTTTTVKSGKKLVTRTVLTPFTTKITLGYFNPNNASALMLDNFASLAYNSPGFLANQFTVTDPTAGVWSIGGEIDSPATGPAPNGAVNFTNIKTLAINTNTGASSDNISFSVGDASNGGGEDLATGLQSVTINTGAGNDTLSFDDSASAAVQPYVISPTLMLPTQPAISPFLGYTYSGVEALDVTGTQGNNSFFVTPSKTTFYNIDGQDPPTGTLPPDGDKLSVRVAGTTGASEFDDGAGTGTWSFASGQKPINFTNIENIVQPTAGIIVESGDGTSSKPLVKVLNAETKQLEYEFYAYEQTYRGGVHVAVADVNGGVPDLIVAPGIGRVGEVKVYDGQTLMDLAVGNFVANPDLALIDSNGIIAQDDLLSASSATVNLTTTAGSKIATVDNPFNLVVGQSIVSPNLPANTVVTAINVNTSTITLSVAAIASDPGSTAVIAGILPEGSKYTNGLNVAAGDLNGDTLNDFAVSLQRGLTKVDEFYNQGGGTFNSTTDFSFVPYAARTVNGAVIGIGDTNGDGTAEIVTAPGPGSAAQVKVFDAQSGTMQVQFNAFTPTFRNGVSLAVGDMNNDGLAEIVVAAGAGGNSQVQVYDATLGKLEKQFQAFTTNPTAAVRLAAIDPDGAGVDQIYAVQALGGASHQVRLFDPLGASLVDSYIESQPDFAGGFDLA